MFLVGLLAAIAGWLVSFVSLGIAVTRGPRDLILPAVLAFPFTFGIIVAGNGSSWNVNEPESYVAVALFFVVALTSAGVLVNRWRKGLTR